MYLVYLFSKYNRKDLVKFTVKIFFKKNLATANKCYIILFATKKIAKKCVKPLKGF